MATMQALASTEALAANQGSDATASAPSYFSSLPRKPRKGGKPLIESAATRAASAVRGMARPSPRAEAELARARLVVEVADDEEERRTCRARARARNVMAAASPIGASEPRKSVSVPSAMTVVQASATLRSVARRLSNAPQTAVMPPTTVSDHVQAGVPPSVGCSLREQVDARLDHRGRVQVRADGRRRGHGVRQPEVERELRRLREGAEQHEDEDRRVERVPADQRRPAAAISEMRPVPAHRRAAAGRPPAAQARPLPVTRSAWRALSRALSLAWSKPISRNDATVVSSQNTKSRIRSSARTSPSIATMKSRKNAKNRPWCGWPRKYAMA